MAEICLCGCPKERHRFNTGRCIRCGEGMCPKYTPESVGLSEPPIFEPAPGELIKLPETPAIRQFVDAYVEQVGPIPVATEEEIAEHLAGGNDVVQFTRAESALPPAPPLESFDAWRCVGCGSRSFRQVRCEVRPSCSGRWAEPVRVEIHSREVTR